MKREGWERVQPWVQDEQRVRRRVLGKEVVDVIRYTEVLRGGITGTKHLGSRRLN